MHREREKQHLALLPGQPIQGLPLADIPTRDFADDQPAYVSDPLRHHPQAKFPPPVRVAGGLFIPLGEA